MPAEADSVTLNGQTLLVQGARAGKSVSEFTSGLKIGRATQDDRQHAFYNDFDDFSGGFGQHQLDIREALGTHWDNAGGVDLRRSRHITLPPKRYVIDADNEPGSMQLSSEILSNAAIGVPRTDASGNVTDYFYFGAGDTIYRMTTDRDSLTRVVKFVTGAAGAGEFQVSGALPTKVTRLFTHRGTDLTSRLYVVVHDAASGGPTAKFLYTADPGVAAPTWIEGSRFLWDAITGPLGSKGQHIVVAQETTFRLMFSLQPETASTDWNIDDTDTTITGPLWIPNGIVKFLGVGTSPWAGSTPAVYFIDLGDGRLYALNFPAATAEPIDLGDFHYLLNGVMWQGFVAVTDGWDVWLYSPGGGGQETVRQIGMFTKDGIPPSFRAGRYRISGLIDGGSYLYAIAEYLGGDGKATTLGYLVLVFNGTGWSIHHPEVTQLQSSSATASNPMAALIDRHPVGLHVASNIQNTTSRALALLCQADPGTGLKVNVHSIRLPAIGRIPIDGIDEFHADSGGHAFLTGWLNGGFSDLDGVLHYIKIDLQECLAGCTVAVAYRLDDDETAGFTAVDSGVATASARGTTVMQFDPTNLAGVQFRTVQFRITLDRGDATQLNGAISDANAGTFNVDSTTGWEDTGIIQIDSEVMEYSSITSTSFTVAANADRGIRGTTAATHTDDSTIDVISRTPELRGITLVYGKKAPLRHTWLVTVDVDKMVEQAITGTGWSGTATHQKVWDFLNTTWDTQTLVQLIIPEKEESAKNLRVQIADVNDLSDDARHSTTVRGRATVTFIEPVRAT